MNSKPSKQKENLYPKHFNVLRGVEFFLLCIVIPSIIIYFVLAKIMFFFLWGTALVCYLIYQRQHLVSFKDLWKWEAVTKRTMAPILWRWVICTIGMFFFTYFYDQEKLFNLVLSRPHVAVMLVFLYPVLSALPQEFIFCTYFFERFKVFFPTETSMIIASAVVFAYAHILYINPVAPSLSLIGGLIFARTYAQTKSLALVTIEHGLYGNSLFLIGLGWYFYGGAVAMSSG